MTAILPVFKGVILIFDALDDEKIAIISVKIILLGVIAAS
jgi:hypothetical protein